MLHAVWPAPSKCWSCCVPGAACGGCQHCYGPSRDIRPWCQLLLLRLHLQEESFHLVDSKPKPQPKFGARKFQQQKQQQLARQQREKEQLQDPKQKKKAMQQKNQYQQNRDNQQRVGDVQLVHGLRVHDAGRG